MIFGIGTDLAAIHRFKKYENPEDPMTRRFTHRILTSSELQSFLRSKYKSISLAKHWAAKEAVTKALGTGLTQGVTMSGIELGRDCLGKPLITLSGGSMAWAKKHGVSKVHISLTDEEGLVSAFALAEKD